MGNGAGRIFDIMKKTENPVGNDFITLKVISINPITFSDGDKLIITQDFCVFNKNINLSKITVNDTFSLMVFNDNQLYYVIQPKTTTNDVLDLVTKTYVDNQDTATLNSAKTYTQTYYVSKSSQNVVDFEEDVTFYETQGTHCIFKKSGHIVTIIYQGESTTHSDGTDLFLLPSDYVPDHTIYVPFVKNNNAYGIVQISSVTSKASVNQISSSSITGRVYFSVTYLV